MFFHTIFSVGHSPVILLAARYLMSVSAEKSSYHTGEKADHLHPLELHRGIRYPGRGKKNGIAYISVNYADLFLRLKIPS